MPLARLAKARASLPEGYQFGDAQPPRCHWCGSVEHRPDCGTILREQHYVPHRADAGMDADGYGAGV